MKSISSERCSRPRAARLPPEARRAQILACALRVFARRGIGAARHAQVASEAGVAVSTAFVYFPTRFDLVAAVLGEVEHFYLDLAERVHASDRPAPAVLLAHSSAFAKSVDDHPDHARIWLAWSSAVREDVWTRYLAFEDRVVGIIAKTLARGQRAGSIGRSISPEDGARLVIGAAHLIARMKFSGRPEPELTEFLDALVRALAGGLAPAGAPG
jgi:TetR/AcrR family hemagglutinin/protease transcriptional regulator